MGKRKQPGRRVCRQRLHNAVSHSSRGRRCATPMSSASGVPNNDNAAAAAALARSLNVGAARAYGSITEMVADPGIDCIWLCGPNHRRIENMEEIVAGDQRPGKASSSGSPVRSHWAATSRKPRGWSSLSRRSGCCTATWKTSCLCASLTRGREIAWARGASTTGRPYLARAAEETRRSAHALVLAG